MGRLVAHFKVELPADCLVVSLAICQIPLHCTINDFEVDINVLVNSRSRVVKAVNDRDWTYVVGSLVVKVTRDEDEAPPPVIPDVEGQPNYFTQRIGKYGAAACEAVNRVIKFFKFEMKTPFLQKLPSNHQSFQNAEWKDASGTFVWKGIPTYTFKDRPGLLGELGVQKLRGESAELLQAALANPREPMLYEEILSDAQTALFEHNLRRAVLELAIACELVVERKFLSGDSPAVAAFEYLEDTARYRVRVVDL